MSGSADVSSLYIYVYLLYRHVYAHERELYYYSLHYTMKAHLTWLLLTSYLTT